MKPGTGRIGMYAWYLARVLVVSVIGIGGLSCSGDRLVDPETGGPSETGPTTPVSVQVSPSARNMTVGESQPFQAIVTGASDARVQWSSSSPGVAAVDAGGNVTAIGTGTTTIRATSLASTSASGTASVIVSAPQSTTVDIIVTNTLFNAVDITVNGIGVGSVPGSSTRQAQVPRTTSITVSWALVRTTTTNGVPVGDIITGHFEPVINPGDRINYTIDAVLGQTFIFRPLIVNQTGTTLLMGVNEGLQSQNRCNCTVPPFSTGTVVGYYFLFSNSNVRAYRSSSGYTGSYIYWDGLANNVDRATGNIRLTANTSPAPGIATPRTGSIDFGARLISPAPRSDVLDEPGPAPSRSPSAGRAGPGAAISGKD